MLGQTHARSLSLSLSHTRARTRTHAQVRDASLCALAAQHLALASPALFKAIMRSASAPSRPPTQDTLDYDDAWADPATTPQQQRGARFAGGGVGTEGRGVPGHTLFGSLCRLYAESINPHQPSALLSPADAAALLLRGLALGSGPQGGAVLAGGVTDVSRGSKGVQKMVLRRVLASDTLPCLVSSACDCVRARARACVRARAYYDPRPSPMAAHPQPPAVSPPCMRNTIQIAVEAGNMLVKVVLGTS